MRWKMIFFLFSLFVLVQVQAQRVESVDKKAFGLFRRARVAFQEGERKKALELIEKAKEYDRQFSGLYLLEADIYHRQGEKEKEIVVIKKALVLDSLKNHPYYYFILAGNALEQADYSKAAEYYRLYLRLDQRQQARQEALRQLRNWEFAIEALRISQKKFPELFYQSELPVYWPALDVTGRTLLFTEQNGEHETLWMLKDRVRYPVNFNKSGNYGAASLTADGRMMYFAMKGERNNFDIYVAYRLTDSTWSVPVNLGYPVNTDAWDAQPAISADGSRLYFASTREGGRGGSDIWCSRLLRREPDGKQVWSQPRCLYFNTAGDEMAPFLYFDHKTLFFASDGYPGMGGKDIYKVDVDEATEPLNIGITVNSQKDEFGFFVDRSGEWGYFSSDISGKRCIYRYQLDQQIACPPAVYINLVTENKAGNLMAPDCLVLVDVERGDTLAYYDGVYAQKEMLACVPANRLLLVNAVKKGYLYYSDTLRVEIPSGEGTYSCKICLQPIRKDQTLVLKGIFFDVDDYRLRSESCYELQQLLTFLRLNPEIQIEISGHTDNTGSNRYNAQLSENRAFEVYKYLFLNHIAKERMQYKGYGKEQPIAPNDTEEGKAENRRTEIKILSSEE